MNIARTDVIINWNYMIIISINGGIFMRLKKVLPLILTLSMSMSTLTVTAMAENLDDECTCCEDFADEDCKVCLGIHEDCPYAASKREGLIEPYSDVDNVDSWYSDEKTEFEIKTVDELKEFAELVNEGTSFAGKTVKLTADIDLKDEAWTPIGTKENPFKGTFDGGNNTVSNLKVTGENSYVGFFGRMSDATLKNITIKNADVEGKDTVGALIGSGYTGRIENCSVEGTISINGNYKVGGLTGEGYAVIENCSIDAKGNVTGKYLENNLEGDNVGGLIGYTGEGSCRIIDCSVKGIEVSGVRKVGGLAGAANYGVEIKNSCVENVEVKYNSDSVPDDYGKPAYSIGGLVGEGQGTESSPTEIENSYVKDTTVAGGNGEKVSDAAGLILGSNRNSTETEFENVYYIGDSEVTTPANDFGEPGASVDGETMALSKALEKAKDGDDKKVTIEAENAVITNDVEIPSGVTLVVPEGTNVTVAEDATLTNNGIIDTKGDITGKVEGDGEIVVHEEDDPEDTDKKHGSSFSLEEKKGGSKKNETDKEEKMDSDDDLIFIDVPKSNPNYDAIISAYENGYMTGIDDNVFAPEGTLTRGMAARILWNMAGQPSSSSVAPFIDVTSDAWYAEAIAWAYENGIILGYDSTAFGPNDYVTMEQFEIMMTKYNGGVPTPYTGISPLATRGYIAGRIAK